MWFIALFILSWIAIGVYYMFLVFTMETKHTQNINAIISQEKAESNLREAQARNEECRDKCGQFAMVASYGSRMCEKCPYRKER